MACKETDSGSVLSFLVGARIRATYQLCQAISDDLTEQLNGVLNKLTFAHAVF